MGYDLIIKFAYILYIYIYKGFSHCEVILQYFLNMTSFKMQFIYIPKNIETLLILFTYYLYL